MLLHLCVTHNKGKMSIGVYKRLSSVAQHISVIIYLPVLLSEIYMVIYIGNGKLRKIMYDYSNYC